MKRVAYLACGASFMMAVSGIGSAAYAYGGGGGGGQSTCKPPRISQESPAARSVVRVLSDFSFLVSKDAIESSIRAKVKNMEAELSVSKQSNGSYLVKGRLPEPIAEPGFVRIQAAANSSRTCVRSHGWLVEIGDSGGDG